MLVSLENINTEIETAFRTNKSSLFKSSFELLADEVIKKQLEESVLPLPYLRIACLLQDFYDYADGRNYRDIWMMHNRRVDLSNTWFDVYHREVNQYEVKSKAWMLSGEYQGKTSDVWRVIKTCASKKSEDGADRFDPASYINDDVPHQMALILGDYQSGGIDGSEFVSFIETFLRNGKGADVWMTPLLERVIQHFPSSINFTAGGYLNWDGGYVERADLIFGVDHVSGVLSGRLNIDGVVSTATISIGFKGFVLPPTTAEVHETCFMGVKERISSSPVGVYYRYQLGVGPRRNWWVSVRVDGTFPHNRDEILIVVPDGYKESFVFGTDFVIGEVRRTRVFCSGRWYLFVLVRIKSRPDETHTIEIGGRSVAFAGISPAIRLKTDPARAIWAADAVVVDAAASIEVVGVSDDMSCMWTVNGKECIADGFSLDLLNPQGGLNESRVKATICKDGRIYRRLSINIFHVPFEIANALRSGGRLPSGWSMGPGYGEDCIALRVAGKRGVLLSDPHNVILPIYIEDRTCAWWVERDAVQNTVQESFRDVSLFTRMSDLEGTYLCVPADMVSSSLKVTGREFPVSRWKSKDGVIQIPLDKIIEDNSGREFRYAGNVPELQFELDGHVVGVVAAVPKIPTLCRHAEGGDLGVFLPNRKQAWSEKYIVLVYRDTPSVPELYSTPEMLIEGGLEWKRGAGDQFVSVGPVLKSYLEKYPRGEVFVVLVKDERWNKYSCTVANPFVLKSEAESQILIVRNDDSPYSDDESCVAKQLKSSWGEYLAILPHGHPLKRARITSYEGKISYAECVDYWGNVSSTPSQWKTAFRVMLDSGYNPLMEPTWFNQEVDQLIERVRIRQGRSRITKQLVEDVLKVLLDNHDAKSESFGGVRGDGLCAAIIS